MFRDTPFVAVSVAVLVLLTAASTQAAQDGTAEEARAMLDKAVAAVKEDKAKALDMFTRARAALRTATLCVLRQRLGRHSDRRIRN